MLSRILWSLFISKNQYWSRSHGLWSQIPALWSLILPNFVLLIRDTIYLDTTVLSTVCMDCYFLLKALPEHSTGWNRQWSSTPKLACSRLQHSNLQRLQKLMRQTRSPCNEYESRTLETRLVSPGIYSTNGWIVLRHDSLLKNKSRQTTTKRQLLTKLMSLRILWTSFERVFFSLWQFEKGYLSH